MEAESVEAGDKNQLNNVLSENELASLPGGADKINAYIDTKFEEYLPSKALLESSKAQIVDKIATSEATVLELPAKYEEPAKKLIVADEIVAGHEKHVGILSSELTKANDKIVRLENEIISLKSARDAAINERNDLTRILESRDSEIERLIAYETLLSQQLRGAIDSKCEALALNDEIQSRKLSLQYREKRIEQEKTLLNSQISSLTEGVNRLTFESQTQRLNSTSRLINVETQLSEKVEELNVANETIEQLNEVNMNLTQRLVEQREAESKMSDNYEKELDAKSKLTDLFKTVLDDDKAKTKELQKLLKEATEKYGELETKFKQAESDHEELLEKKNDVITSLKSEIEHANSLFKAAAAHNLDMEISDPGPSVTPACKVLESGMSLTQIYSQLVKVTDELSNKKEENRQLNITSKTIVQELEGKALLLRKQKADYEEILKCNAAFTREIDSFMIDYNRLRDECSEASRIANHYTRENAKLKSELADLGRQLCFLLKEIEHSRGGLLNSDHDTFHATNTSSSDLNSSRVISQTLVTFRDIQELQATNQNLLRMVRELTDKQEELERRKEQFESGEMVNKIEVLTNRLLEITKIKEGQTILVKSLIKQRDIFKQLYDDYTNGKLNEMSSSESEKSHTLVMETTLPHKPAKPQVAEAAAYEIKYKEVEKQLCHLKEEYKTYKELKVTNDRILYEQIDNMRQEIAKLTAANSKCSSTSEYNDKRLEILQTNITTYKKQISTLKEKNKAYNATIAKNEVSLQYLRDDALNAQSKLAAAEIQLENLKLECKFLRDSELRLQTENEVHNRERQGQTLLLKNWELIKASLERGEAENRAKLESRLDEATKECSALRGHLQEERVRFKELASHLECQTETVKQHMQEETDLMRKEFTQLRNDFSEKNKSNEELANKLIVALAPNTDSALDTIKKIKELENKLSDKDCEIQSLTDLLNIAKEHIKQYCDIAEGAEEIKALNKEYESYKIETDAKLTEYAQKLQSMVEKCSELEAELSLQNNGEYSTININLKNELANCKEEFATLLSNLKSSKLDLISARSEIIKLGEAFQKLESEKASWIGRQQSITRENEELILRLKDLNDQNAVLHDQIQALGTQLSVTNASRSHSKTLNELANDSNVNVSTSEKEGKSSEQLLQIVKFLRKEKDIAIAKFDTLQAETTRVRSQLEIVEKQLVNVKLTLAAERERSEVSLTTINKQSDILRKVETINALADSNNILREDRDSLTVRVEELSKSIKSLEEQLNSLQEKIVDFLSINETLQSENTSLKSECARWRTRVNALVERANKEYHEDWKRLQNEREALAKMITNEKRAIKKEMSKLQEQYALSRQHTALVEENKKLNEELQTLKDEMATLIEELTKLKAENNSLTEINAKLTEELSSKDASLRDIKNNEMQLCKIATEYKGRYEEIVKTVDEEKKKAKQVLKRAMSKIEQLSNINNTLSRELDESQNKIDTIEQSTRDELDLKLSVIKSQYENRLSRLEKDRDEAQVEKRREVEALLQKVNMLQRQLANQTAAGKQQTTTKKTTTDPPTANIKPIAGLAQRSVSASRRSGEIPLASIRPMTPRLVSVLTASAASVAPATAAATPATREDAATSASSASSVPPEFTQPPAQSPETGEADEAAAVGSLGPQRSRLARWARDGDSEPTPPH